MMPDSLNSYAFNFCIQTINAQSKIGIFSIGYCVRAGATLEKAGSAVTWENVGNTKEFPSPFYKLIVRQILLGHTAKPDEYNTVEVSIRIYCICHQLPNQLSFVIYLFIG